MLSLGARGLTQTCTSPTHELLQCASSAALILARGADAQDRSSDMLLRSGAAALLAARWTSLTHDTTFS